MTTTKIFLSLSLRNDSLPFYVQNMPKVNKYNIMFTFYHPLLHLDHQPRKVLNMHRLLSIDQASLEELLSTA
jgi:hypothetical protein